MTPARTSHYTFGILTTVAKDIFHSSYHAELLSGIFHKLGLLGHELKIIAASHQPYSSLDQILQNHGLHGLFVLTWRWIHPGFAKLIETTAHERVLVFNDPVSNLRCNIVYTDIEKGMSQAVSHLVRRGYRKIGMLHGPEYVVFKRNGEKTKTLFVDTVLKKESFMKIMKTKRLSVKEPWIRQALANSESEGCRVMKQWLRQTRLPEAIVCGNDDLAFGVLAALKQAGRGVPEDVAVMGFDGNNHARHFRPPLTTIRQPLFRMAQDAVDILIKNVETSGLSPVAKKYPPKLIIRKTT